MVWGIHLLNEDQANDGYDGLFWKGIFRILRLQRSRLYFAYLYTCLPKNWRTQVRETPEKKKQQRIFPGRIGVACSELCGVKILKSDFQKMVPNLLP